METNPLVAGPSGSNSNQSGLVPRFQLLSLQEVSAQRDAEWLIGGVLECETFALLWGVPGSGKSFLGLDFGLCVATGTPWKGHIVRQGPVVYVAAEGGR